jgi:HNH endonuclease
VVNADLEDWTGFEVAHVFPLAYEGHWAEQGYSRWITIPPESGGMINSVQNGLLLRSDIHQLFDSYNLSINPDVSTPCVSITRQELMVIVG